MKVRRVVAALFVLLAGEVSAQQVVDVHLNDKVPSGKQPTLVVSIRQDLSALTLDLERSDGKKVHIQKTNIPRNSERTFTLPQVSGKHRYRGTLTVTFTGGDEGTMNLEFDAEVVAGLGLSVQREDLDLEKRSLLLHSRRPIGRVDYEVTGDDGSRLDQGVAKFPKPHTPVRLAWRQAGGKVLKIRLVARDPDGITEPLELIPWTYHIPHDEVEFETGKWGIRPAETPKLDRSYDLLQKGLAKYGRLLEVKLYVAGYTDTVAAADYNQVLSQKRALAIARFFREKGFQHPIFYQGFGEKGLKVPTPDETDEPRNRRAEYVLAAEPPHLDVPGASTRWTRLQ